MLATICALGYYALQYGEVGALLHEASSQVEAWQAPGAQPTKEAVARVDAELHAARSQAPSDPVANELVGIVEGRTAVNSEQMESAKRHLLEALVFRPTSAYTWANLTEALYKTGETGASFQTALVSSSKLGPFEPEVQRSVAFFGLAVWNEVSAPVRADIERIVASGMRRNPLEMLRIAERRGRLDVACRHLPRETKQMDVRPTNLCASVEATP